MQINIYNENGDIAVSSLIVKNKKCGTIEDFDLIEEPFDVEAYNGQIRVFDKMYFSNIELIRPSTPTNTLSL